MLLQHQKGDLMKVLERPCAWCPRDPNEPPETSHGICPDCAQKMKDQSDARHWDDVPSYVENREAFNAYRASKRR